MFKVGRQLAVITKHYVVYSNSNTNNQMATKKKKLVDVDVQFFEGTVLQVEDGNVMVVGEVGSSANNSGSKKNSGTSACVAAAEDCDDGEYGTIDELVGYMKYETYDKDYIVVSTEKAVEDDFSTVSLSNTNTGVVLGDQADDVITVPHANDTVLSKKDDDVIQDDDLADHQPAISTARLVEKPIMVPSAATSTASSTAAANGTETSKAMVRTSPVVDTSTPTLSPSTNTLNDSSISNNNNNNNSNSSSSIKDNQPRHCIFSSKILSIFVEGDGFLCYERVDGSFSFIAKEPSSDGKDYCIDCKKLCTKRKKFGCHRHAL